jgi:hypothetical protein
MSKVENIVHNGLIRWLESIRLGDGRWYYSDGYLQVEDAATPLSHYLRLELKEFTDSERLSIVQRCLRIYPAPPKKNY